MVSKMIDLEALEKLYPPGQEIGAWDEAIVEAFPALIRELKASRELIEIVDAACSRVSSKEAALFLILGAVRGYRKAMK